MTTETVDEVFAKTLVGDYDDEAPWAAVRELQGLGAREVFDRAAEWCISFEPLRRARGADVLAQLGRTSDHHENNYPEDSFAVISSLIQTEKELKPLSSAIYALGHIGDPRAVPLLVQYQNHSDAEIRYALAAALGTFTSDAIAVDVLVRLTGDEDEDVRDWATFGIGALGKTDSPAIRDALIGRLEDSFEDARQEAIVGLARLKDERVLPALLSTLDESKVPDIIVEAAIEMLGSSESAEVWMPAECAAALREKFGL
jgi:HEAT repeat protein